MHETRLVRDLLATLASTAAGPNGRRITKIRVELGALSCFSPDHFREHFEIEASGTPAAGAVLEISVSTDPAHPRALDVVLDSIEVDDP